MDPGVTFADPTVLSTRETEVYDDVAFLGMYMFWGRLEKTPLSGGLLAICLRGLTGICLSFSADPLEGQPFPQGQ